MTNDNQLIIRVLRRMRGLMSGSDGRAPTRLAGYWRAAPSRGPVTDKLAWPTYGGRETEPVPSAAELRCGCTGHALFTSRAWWSHHRSEWCCWLEHLTSCLDYTSNLYNGISVPILRFLFVAKVKLIKNFSKQAFISEYKNRLCCDDDIIKISWFLSITRIKTWMVYLLKWKIFEPLVKNQYSNITIELIRVLGRSAKYRRVMWFLINSLLPFLSR